MEGERESLHLAYALGQLDTFVRTCLERPACRPPIASWAQRSVSLGRKQEEGLVKSATTFAASAQLEVDAGAANKPPNNDHHHNQAP